MDKETVTRIFPAAGIMAADTEPAEGLMEPIPRFEFVSYAEDVQREAGLPARKTCGSAGYDFTMPFDVYLTPGEVLMFKTGIKAYMRPWQVLLLFVRSSIGINRSIVLANGTGIIDSDYADNRDNEGNITAALMNAGEKPQVIEKGERYMQGIFVPFITVPGEVVTKQRTGGIGSTNVEKEEVRA